MRVTPPSDPAVYWDALYRHRSAQALSWYRLRLDTSLALLERAGLRADSRVIDVGAGASTLVDDLLDRGLRSVTALDLAATSLDVARRRLGARARHVTWLIGDVANAALPAAAYTHWHDRAVLHFLSEPEHVQAYAAQAAHAVAADGHAVIGGFAPGGPERCSGLPVIRRSAADIAALLSPAFTLVASADERHETPGGTEQAFTYALLRRAP